MRTIFILFISLSSISYAQSTKTEQHLLELSRRKFTWMVNKNLDSLNDILDERVKYIHSNGWTETKQDVIDDIKNGKLVYENVAVAEAQARIFDNTAIVNGKGKFSGIINNTSFSFDLMYTEVYVKKGNKWILVSRHANKI